MVYRLYFNKVIQKNQKPATPAGTHIVKEAWGDRTPEQGDVGSWRAAILEALFLFSRVKTVRDFWLDGDDDVIRFTF